MGSEVEKVGKEVKRAGQRIVKDPTSALTLGISVDGSTLGIGGVVDRLKEPVTKQIAEMTGVAEIQRGIEAEEAAAQAENEAALVDAKNQRRQDTANRASSKGAKVRLGAPSSSLGINRTGAQI